MKSEPTNEAPMKSDVRLVLTRFSEDVDFKAGVVRNFLYFEDLDGNIEPFRIPVPEETTQELVRKVFSGPTRPAASSGPAENLTTKIAVPEVAAPAQQEDGLDENGDPIFGHPANAWMDRKAGEGSSAGEDDEVESL